MPNICENSLRVPVSHADKVFDLVPDSSLGEDSFTFSKLVPQPAHQPNVDQPNFFDAKGLGLPHSSGSQLNWYDWRIANWSTKWDATDVSFSKDGDHVTAYFDTAWSPPEKYYNELVHLGIPFYATAEEPGLDLYINFSHTGDGTLDICEVDPPNHIEDDDTEDSEVLTDEEVTLFHAPSSS